MKRKVFFLILCFILSFNLIAYAAITPEQGNDVATFARNFVEKGNARRDEKGYPLLTYALSGNWNTCIEIRNKGYNEQLYYVKNNSYYYRNGKYVELGNKWCMDCGTFVTYNLKTTLGLDLYNQKEPWHIQEIYNDACKGKNSKYFEFVYKSISVGNIDYSKLQKGDVLAQITSHGNHGMIYVGDGMIAHANRDMITFKAPVTFGVKISKLNHYYYPSTRISIMRVKDGVIPSDYVVNSKVTWPDTGEVEYLVNNSKTMLETISDDKLVEISNKLLALSCEFVVNMPLKIK